MGHISGLTYKKAKIFLKFLGSGKKYILDHRDAQIMRVIIKHQMDDIMVVIDGIERIWPNKIEHQVFKQQFKNNMVYQLQASFNRQIRNVIVIPKTEEDQTIEDDFLVEDIKVHTHLRL